MRFDTKGILIDSFLCKRDKTFFYKRHLNISQRFYRVTALNKIHFLINGHTVEHDAVEVKIKFYFKLLLGAVTL